MLPGWSGTAEYNFDARASTQLASRQLDTLLQSGPHNWLNKAIETSLDDILKETDVNIKTANVAAFLNFLHEANDPSSTKSGVFKTFTSLRDPLLLKEYGRVPSRAELLDDFTEALNIDNIRETDAEKAALALNPRKVEGKLVIDSTIDNGGLFFKTLV